MTKATTDQEYHEDSAHWGENKYVTLENVIDNIILTADDDSYFKKIKKFRASIHGKLGIKKLNVDVKSEPKAIAIQLSPAKIFPYPRYMTNWYRVSVINECDKLTVLNINTNPTIKDYLQDDEYDLIYDESGAILRGADFNAEKGDCCLPFQSLDCECNEVEDCTCGCTSTTYEDSWVKDVVDGSYFEFSDDLVDKIIVIEFKSAGLDGLADCDIKIDNRLEMTITRWIQWQLLMGKRNVPLSEVAYYHSLYKIEKGQSKNLLQDKISLQQILKSVSLRYNN